MYILLCGAWQCVKMEGRDSIKYTILISDVCNHPFISHLTTLFCRRLWHPLIPHTTLKGSYYLDVHLRKNPSFCFFVLSVVPCYVELSPGFYCINSTTSNCEWSICIWKKAYIRFTKEKWLRINISYKC